MAPSAVAGKRLLLTGAAGFVGANFTDYTLRHTDWEIVCLDRLDHAGNLNRLAGLPAFGEHFGQRVSVAYHDLRAAVSNNTARALGSFDYIVHMAAGSHVDRSILDPTGFVEDNVNGTAHALDFARRGGLRDGGRFVYFSTDEVFGPAPPGISFKPWAQHNPQNPYAAAKAGGESLCPSYAACYGLPIIVTHCTNVIGPGQDEEKFLPRLVRALHEGKTVEVHAVHGIPCSRYYTHVDNISSAALFLLEHGTILDGSAESGRYNISGEREVDNLELVRLVADIMVKVPDMRLMERPPGRIKPDLRYCVDDSATRALGWVQPVTFLDGLIRAVTADRVRLCA